MADKAPEEKKLPSTDMKLIETAKRVLDKAAPNYFIVFGDADGTGWGGNVGRTWAMGALLRALENLKQQEKMDAIKQYTEENT